MKSLALCAAVAICITSMPAYAYNPRSATEQELQHLRAAMQKRLFDADSAKFLDVRVDDGDVCGQVNAKNRLGGYTGYTRFYAIMSADGEMTVIVAIDSRDSRTAAEMCFEKGLG